MARTKQTQQRAVGGGHDLSAGKKGIAQKTPLSGSSSSQANHNTRNCSVALAVENFASTLSAVLSSFLDLSSHCHISGVRSIQHASTAFVPEHVL